MRNILFILILFSVPICGHATINTSYGPITKSDQLWQIAIFVRPNATVSITQTMAALQKKNPNAFIGNKLKTGVILQVPSMAEIQAARLENQSSSKSLDYSLRENDAIKTLLLKFDQQYQDRLADMEQYNIVMQNRIVKLMQQINMLQNEVNQLKTPTNTESFYVKLRDSFAGYGLYVLAGIIILFLLLLLWICSSPGTKKIAVKTEEDTEDEYDFMGSTEGIPAKLDLARAYIDMDDKKGARKILAEVSKKGNKKQQKEARALLARIK